MRNPKLDPKKIRDTIGLLKKRINDRFPNSSLGYVCGDLYEIAQKTDETILHIQKPRLGWRLVVISFVLAVLLFSGITLLKCESQTKIISLTEMVQVLDALFNILVLTGGAIIFLVSVENRRKRRNVTQAVNELRCLAHVIDAHQLTKDPCYLESNVIRTSHSPERNMDSFTLSRYLDYCSEMLSLISIVGFLYIQDYHDAVAVEAVNDLEDLSNGLSRKIWQKIINIKRQETPIVK